MMKNTSRGAVIALSVAALFGTSTAVRAAEAGSPTDAPKSDAKIHCAGVNECAGKSTCAGGTGGSSCAGANSCKGKGVIDTTAADCDKRGGTVVKD